MSPERKLVLLPVDGSDQSLEVVKYVSKAVNLSQAEVVLLSIIDKMPDIFWEMGQDPTVSKHLEHMESWDTYKEQRMRDCMDNACSLLKTAGIPKDAMTCNIQKRKVGIARDILDECKYGYNAVAIGRRGLGQMDEAMLGSIAAKVFINVVDAPVCLLGGKPKPGKILVGMDDSLSAVRASNFVAKMLSNPDVNITLAHVARIPQTKSGKAPSEKDVAKIVQEHEEMMKPVFDSTIKSLTAAGVKPENINVKVIKSSGSRAVNLYNEAKSGKYGSIVVGRKGMSDVEEFTMGRIPYKLGQIAKNVALWLVP
jgi:nucleotide-binding universal stress UspA family protein